MTDKLIIDGVDVSECIFYQANFEEDFDVKIKHFCSNWHNSCESVNNSNCYFKQLARKTQECEELKKEVELLKQYKGSKQASYESMQIEWNKAVLCSRNLLKQVEEWQEKYNQLKAENEQLKANSTEWKTFDVSFHDGFVKTQISDMSLAEYSQLKLEKQQANQKLEQIKELLTNITEARLCEAKECGCDDNKECLECTLNEIKDIIQIIDMEGTMKSKEEIEQKLKIYEEIHARSNVFTSEFTLSSGAITALKWVLGIDGVE